MLAGGPQLLFFMRLSSQRQHMQQSEVEACPCRVEKMASSSLARPSRAAAKKVTMLDQHKIKDLKQERRALQALQGSSYTVPFHGLYPEEPHLGGTAFLVMGSVSLSALSLPCSSAHALGLSLAVKGSSAVDIFRKRCILGAVLTAGHGAYQH